MAMEVDLFPPDQGTTQSYKRLFFGIKFLFYLLILGILIFFHSNLFFFFFLLCRQALQIPSSLKTILGLEFGIIHSLQKFNHGCLVSNINIFIF